MKIKALKYSYSFLIIIVLFSVVLMNANPPADDVVKEITKSISDMDSKKLADYFSDAISLELDNSSGNYSKSQAEIILRDFFKDNPVQSFTINHQGDSKDGSRYFIGTYKTATKKFRVYGLLKKETDNLFLQQLQFDEE